MIEGIVSYNIPSVYKLQNKVISLLIEHFLKEKTFGVVLNEKDIESLNREFKIFLESHVKYTFEKCNLTLEEKTLKGEIKIKDCAQINIELKNKETK